MYRATITVKLAPDAEQGMLARLSWIAKFNTARRSGEGATKAAALENAQ